MNHLILVGRIVRDIQTKRLDEHLVLNNTLAIQRKHRDKEGQYQTDFIPIIAWNKVAEIIEKYCVKGQRIGILGTLQSRTYTSNEQQRHIVECVIQEVTLLDRPITSNNSPQFGTTLEYK